MSTALDGVDVVHIRVDVFRIVGVIHDGHLDGDALLLGLQVNDVINQMCAMAVDIAHKLLQSVFGMESFLFCLAFLVRTQVAQCDGDAGIQIGQLTHTTSHDVVFVFGGGEDGGIGPELLTRTRFVGVAHNLHVIERLSLLVFLLIDMAVAIDLRCHVLRQGVHTADAHTMKSTRDLVTALVELTAGMQHSHHHFQSALVHLLMFIHRDTTSVVLHGDGVVFIDGYFDVFAVSCHRLVDGVVHSLVHQMVQSFFTDVTNIHSRALADGFESFQHLNVTGRVVILVVLNVCHFCFLKSLLL